MSEFQTLQDLEDDDFDLDEMLAAVGELASKPKAFQRAADAFVKQDATSFHAALAEARVKHHCRLLCRWFCLWHCRRLCLVLGVRDEARLARLEPIELSRAIAQVAAREGALEELAAAAEAESAEGFARALARFEVAHFGPLICAWICSVRCHLICRWICSPIPHPVRPGLLAALREEASALTEALQDPEALASSFEPFERGDHEGVEKALTPFPIHLRCWLSCRWLCFLVCWRRCIVFCRPLPVEIPVREWLELSLRIAKLARQRELAQLQDAFERDEPDAFHALVARTGLGPLCWVLCRLFCRARCVRVCRWVCRPIGAIPSFTHVGAYNYSVAIDSGSSGGGLTVADKRAFHGNLRLNGVLPKKLGAAALEYRFEVKIGSSWTPVPLALVAPTKIGVRQRFVGVWPVMQLETLDYVVNGAPSPTVLVPATTADGWIRVPQESDAATIGYFYPNGNLINLRSGELLPWPTIDVGAIVPGQSTAPAGLGVDQIIGLRMMVRPAGSSGTGTPAGTCERVALYNRRYDDVSKGGSWAPTKADQQLGVAMLDIAEIGAGCAQITSQLTVKYTAAHPNLGSVKVWMEGPGGPYTFGLSPDAGSGDQNQFGHALPDGFVIGSLQQCSYLVWLSAEILLTDGDNAAGSIEDHVAFCKHDEVVPTDDDL